MVKMHYTILCWKKDVMRHPYIRIQKKVESWFELGVPNDEYRKTGRFESRVNNMY